MNAEVTHVYMVPVQIMLTDLHAVVTQDTPEPIVI